MENSDKFGQLFDQREKKAYSLELAPRRVSPSKMGTREPTPPSSNETGQSIAS